MKNNIKVCLYCLILIAISVEPLFASSQSQSCLSTQWPSEFSQLKPDPSLKRGTLKNQFKYVVKQNHEPQERVAIYLLVKAGSLNENDSQRGLAHFLEHLMFNGSENFPPGSLVDYFQSIGMDYGGDTNARTTFDKTVYNIVLPSGSTKDLDSGFLIMADYARRALLLDEEIDRERDVILSEKRARDSAGYRTSVASSSFAFRGTRYPLRRPIGVLETLVKADRQLLKSYYDGWYRPENMICVVVGDVEVDLAKALIEKHFANLESSGPAPQCPEFGKLDHNGLESFYHFESELGKTNISIETLWDLPLENDSIDLERRELVKFIGSLIAGYRLQKLQENKQPFSDAGYHTGDILNRIGYGSIAAETDADGWEGSLAVLDNTLRQIFQFGFVENEVERAKREILAQIDENVLTLDSQDSRRIARRIIDSLNNNRVYQSPHQEEEIYKPIVENITVEDVNDSFRAVWNHDSRLVSVTGDASLGKSGADLVKSAYQRAQKLPIKEFVVQKGNEFPYLQTKQILTSDPQTKYLKEIDVEQVKFQNGLLVNLKKTQFSKNRFNLVVNYGSGEQTEPHPGLAMVAGDVINGSGSGRFTQTALDELVAGSSLELSFRVGKTSFAWGGTALNKDFRLFIQMLHTLLLDPGLRENVFVKERSNYELMYNQSEQEIEGNVALKVQPFLANYNEHFGLPPWTDIEKIDFDMLAKWILPQIKPKDLEISIVGDFDREEVVKILGEYFGSVELARPEIPQTPIVTFPAGKKIEVQVQTSLEKSHITVAWPTDDFWDIHQTRRLHILANVMGDRIRKTVREQLGASYSPHVSSFASRVYQDYGYIIAQMIVEPGSEDKVIGEILRISSELQGSGITSDELERVRKPLNTSLKDSIKTNRYWLYSVLSLSSRYPQKLEWPKTIISDFSSISKSEVNLLASKYLNNSKAAIARVVPE